jgi:uncharacterized membrane protein SpoIIM required for sporulation
MKVAKLLKTRRENWHKLEQLCAEMEGRRKREVGARQVARFAALHRAVCADLALADAYQLPVSTVQYLHRLVGRAHNQLYRSRAFNLSAWSRMLLHDVPQRVFNDRCIQLVFVLFWGLFLGSAYLAASPEVWPSYAEQMLSPAVIDHLESDFATSSEDENRPVNPEAVSRYINHNTGIGLQCFALGLLVIPGLFVLVFNAAFLGAVFGYMARPDIEGSANFFRFVTAHGPFELTAIVLSAGAGLRLGISWLNPRSASQGGSLLERVDDPDDSGISVRPPARFSGTLSRVSALRKTAREMMPVMGTAMFLFFGAAMIEGLLSPSPAPYWIKATVAVISSGLLMFYFLILGFPRRRSRAA